MTVEAAQRFRRPGPSYRSSPGSTHQRVLWPRPRDATPVRYPSNRSRVGFNSPERYRRVVRRPNRVLTDQCARFVLPCERTPQNCVPSHMPRLCNRFAPVACGNSVARSATATWPRLMKHGHAANLSALSISTSPHSQVCDAFMHATARSPREVSPFWADSVEQIGR